MNRRSIPFPPCREKTADAPDRETPEVAYTIVSADRACLARETADGNDPLLRYREAWCGSRAARADAPTLLDNAWEESVMRAIRAEAAPRRAETDILRWLAGRLRPLALANAALILLGLCMLWQMTPSAKATGLQAYAEVSTFTYGEFQR